jgi:transposase
MPEEKEYMTLDEAANFLGIKRATLYNYMNKLNIEAIKFKLDRRSYLSQGQVKQLKEIQEKPWLAGREEKKPEQSSGEDKPMKPAA